ncbi:MAG: peptidoglycan editing factor PgeF [Ruminococcaceae bacterium]|nr:peptidoglycan editing factor PgeF [Oscillospiraceae bacterium]
MNIKNSNGFYYITSSLFEKYGIKHLFTTTKADCQSEKPDFGFNILNREMVLSNYKRVAEIFDVSLNNIVKSTQIHQDNIEEITPTHMGMGIVKETVFDNADGIYTKEKNIPLCIFSADCVPILYSDKQNSVVMAVHAGWRGSSLDITGKGVRILKEKYNVKPSDIICAIGPAIGKCCYEVSGEVIEKISEVTKISDFYEKISLDKFYIDLKNINKKLLLNEGVLEENIDVCNFCTKCEKDLFHSYRREKENAGRNAGFIML